MQMFTPKSTEFNRRWMPNSRLKPLLASCLLCLAALIASPSQAAPPASDPIELEITRLATKLSSYLSENFDAALANVEIKSPQGSSTAAKGLTAALRQQLSRQGMELTGGSKAIAGEVKFARTPSGRCLVVITLDVLHQDQSTLISLRGRRIELADFNSVTSFAERQLKKDQRNEIHSAIAQQ